MTQLRPVAENIWLLTYPLRLAGLQIGRNVTVIRVRDGRLLIHSTAPFAAQDVAAISALGEPAWLVDASLFHDSFAKEGRKNFPDLPYLAPQGFTKASGVSTTPLDPPPVAWAGEIDVLPLLGARAHEHVFYHRPSRTLIVCDLLFNFGPNASPWTRWFARHLMRLPDGIGMSAFFRLTIGDRAAFQQSLRQMMDWPFDRIIVGHGDIIEANAKQIALDHFTRAGFQIT